MGKYKLDDRLYKMIENEEEKCIGCKLCTKGCPMLEIFSDNPKDLLKELLEEASFDYELPYSCMLCGYCREVCPKDVDFEAIFVEMRKEVFKLSKNKLPRELGYGGVKFHQANSFSSIFSTDIKNLNGDTIFFPGCSIMAYSPEIVERTYRYLDRLIPGIGIYINCCGKPTISMGDEKSFEQYHSILETDFESNNVKTVVTACLNCYKTLKENTRGIEVITLWEVLAEKGIPKDKIGIGKDIENKFILHDPCPTRDIDSIHEGVRRILDDLGLEVVEMKNSKRNTLCCGSGGMVGGYKPDLARARKIDRAKEVSGEKIVTYCEECVESMKIGGKDSVHILDLLFNDDIYDGFNQEDMTLVSKWINRFKGKIRFNKI